MQAQLGIKLFSSWFYYWFTFTHLRYLWWKHAHHFLFDFPLQSNFQHFWSHGMWSERFIFCCKKALMLLGYLPLLSNHWWEKQSHLIILTYSIAHTVLWVTARWWRFRSMSSATFARWAYRFRFFVQKFLLHNYFTRLLHRRFTFLLFEFFWRMYPRFSMLADVFSACLNAFVGFNSPIKFTFVFNRII